MLHAHHATTPTTLTAAAPAANACSLFALAHSLRSLALCASSPAPASRAVLELERKLVALQQEIESKKPEEIRLKEEISHTERRKRASEKSLEKVTEQQAKGEQQLASLQAELDEVGEKIGGLEAEAGGEDEASELSMGTKQRAEYNTLKAQAGADSAALQEQIGCKKRELRDLAPTLLTLRTRVEELTAERTAIEDKVAALGERRVAGSEKGRVLLAELKAFQAEAESLKDTSTSTREKRAAAEVRLGEVIGQLRSSKAEHRETEREKKSKEAIENMARLFPGVFGRMTDICKPTQRKYQAAVVTAMGKNMDAVVVDTEKTAMDCITYLKEKKCAPETFIPLDTIRAKPVREALRQLGGTKMPVQDVITAAEKYAPYYGCVLPTPVACFCHMLPPRRAATVTAVPPPRPAHHKLPHLLRRRRLSSSPLPRRP